MVVRWRQGAAPALVFMSQLPLPSKSWLAHKLLSPEIAREFTDQDEEISRIFD